MKLKQECVRYVLLSLEQQGFEMTQQGVQLPDIQSALANANFSNDDISYTLIQLLDGKYINAKYDKYNVGFSLIVYDITWKGHELLDSIRDDKVWENTKKATQQLKSVSIGILSNVASAVLTSMIKQATGLPL